MNVLIHKYCCCVTMQIRGDVSLSSRLVLGGKEVDVLQIKSMKEIYTSMPNARWQGHNILYQLRDQNRCDVSPNLG
jgi:hypothetical protein